MKTLAIAASLVLVALAAPQAWAQQPIIEPPADDTLPAPDEYTAAPSPAPYVIEPVDAADTYDEDGYDVEYDVYYDTVAAENYDDGYDPNAYQQFQSALDPYGNWVSDPTYGQVWVPAVSAVGVDFMPYASGGHWVLTEYGWTWVSDWDWGWAPFHYGRWISLATWGWCWIPGSIWGPGWVAWRSGGGYAGWAPLPPRGVTVGPPRGTRSPWRFVLAHQLGERRHSFLPSHVVPAVFAKTSVVTNLRNVNSVRFNAGPNAATIRAPFRPIPLHTTPRALPRPTVVARAGIPLQARPWYRAPAAHSPSIALRPGTPHPRAITLGANPGVNNFPPVVRRPMGTPVTPPRPIYAPPRSYNGSLTVVRPHYQPPPAYQPPAAPTYRAPSYQAPTYHAPAPSYQAPTYHAPAPMYRAPAPTYHAPAPTYHAPAPTYHAPAPTYHAPAPTYRAPAPTYHAPAPTFRAPAPAPSFGGGGFRHR